MTEYIWPAIALIFFIVLVWSIWTNWLWTGLAVLLVCIGDIRGRLRGEKPSQDSDEPDPPYKKAA